MKNKIYSYIKKWKTQGYPEDIPDTVPSVLSDKNLAPSYKAIAIAILKNDSSLKTLGFSPKKSKWYSVLKRIEIKKREGKNGKNI